MQVFYKLLYSSALNPLVIFFCKYILRGAVQIPPSGVLSFTTSAGKEVKLETNQTCHVTKHVYYEGYDSYEYSELFIKIIKNFSSFFDVGSNIGYYSVLAATHNPAINVYAFDPSPGPYHYLQKNIALNGISNQVKAYDTALSDENGEVVFSIAAVQKYSYLQFNNLGGSGHISALRDTALTQKKTVKTETLDHFIERNTIEAFDIMKMDAENAEHLILQGGAKAIAKYRPVIFTEVFSEEMADLLEQTLLNLDFTVYNLNGSTPKRIQSLKTDLGSGINNIVLVPAEKCALFE